VKEGDCSVLIALCLWAFNTKDKENCKNNQEWNLKKIIDHMIHRW